MDKLGQLFESSGSQKCGSQKCDANSNGNLNSSRIQNEAEECDEKSSQIQNETEKCDEKSNQVQNEAEKRDRNGQENFDANGQENVDGQENFDTKGSSSFDGHKNSDANGQENLNSDGQENSDANGQENSDADDEENSGKNSENSDASGQESSENSSVEEIPDSANQKSSENSDSQKSSDSRKSSEKFDVPESPKFINSPKNSPLIFSLLTLLVLLFLHYLFLFPLFNYLSFYSFSKYHHSFKIPSFSQILFNMFFILFTLIFTGLFKAKNGKNIVNSNTVNSNSNSRENLLNVQENSGDLKEKSKSLAKNLAPNFEEKNECQKNEGQKSHNFSSKNKILENLNQLNNILFLNIFISFIYILIFIILPPLKPQKYYAPSLALIFYYTFLIFFLANFNLFKGAFFDFQKNKKLSKNASPVGKSKENSKNFGPKNKNHSKNDRSVEKHKENTTNFRSKSEPYWGLKKKRPKKRSLWANFKVKLGIKKNSSQKSPSNSNKNLQIFELKNQVGQKNSSNSKPLKSLAKKPLKSLGKKSVKPVLKFALKNPSTSLKIGSKIPPKLASKILLKLGLKKANKNLQKIESFFAYYFKGSLTLKFLFIFIVIQIFGCFMQIFMTVCFGGSVEFKRNLGNYKRFYGIFYGILHSLEVKFLGDSKNFNFFNVNLAFLFPTAFLSLISAFFFQLIFMENQDSQVEKSQEKGSKIFLNFRQVFENLSLNWKNFNKWEKLKFLMSQFFGLLFLFSGILTLLWGLNLGQFFVNFTCFIWVLVG